jgi:ParB-like chromosome segregation protein Spo0J
MVPVGAIELPRASGIEVREPAAEEIEACVAAIQLNGEIGHPLTVRPIGGGRFELVDGQYRLAGAIELGLAEVPCRVRDLTDREAATVSLVLDLTRRKPAADLARAWAITEALQLLGLRPVEFAGISRYNEGEISEARRFANALPKERVVEYAERTGVPIEEIGRTPRDVLRSALRSSEGGGFDETVAAVQEAVAPAAASRAGAVLSLAAGAVRVSSHRLAALPLLLRLRLILQLICLLLRSPTSPKFAKLRAAKKIPTASNGTLWLHSRSVRTSPALAGSPALTPTNPARRPYCRRDAGSTRIRLRAVTPLA